MASLSMMFKLLGKDVSASKAFKGVGGAAAKTGKRVEGMSVLAGVSLAAVGAAAIKLGTDSVKAFTEAEQSQAKFESSLAKNSLTAYTDDITKLAESLALKTRFDDDATKSGAAVLANFGMTGEQLQKTLPLVQDYAAFTGKDLPSASKLLGNAFLGNTRALKELGIAYKPTGDKAKDMAAIMDLVNEKVGGFAEKEGKTAAGQAAILSNQFGEVQETIGASLLPILMTLADFAITTLIPAIQSLAEWVGQNIEWLAPLAAGIAVIVGAIKVWAIVQAALNIVMALNPIGLVVIAIAALVAGIIIAYKNSETFRNIVQAAWNGIKVAAQAVVNWFQNTAWPMLKKVIGFIIGYYKMLWTAFKLVAGWIGEKVGEVVGVFTGMADSIYGAFKSVFNGIASLWNNTVGRLSFGVPDWVPGMGGKGFDVPDIPMLARGGIVTRPTLALIGEAGPEAVVPLSRGGGYGTTVVLNINGPVAGPGAGRWLADEIKKATTSGRTRLA